MNEEDYLNADGYFIPDAIGDPHPDISKWVYVDGLQEYPWENLPAVARRYNIKHWCHLFSLDRETLCELALTIGCKLSWEQPPREIRSFIVYHFDITPTMRERAVKAGAVEVSTMAGLVRNWIKEFGK